MIEWRKWLFDRVNATAGITAEVGDRVFSTIDIAQLPFIVIRLGAEQPEIPNVAYSNDAVLWVHDEPGSYVRIDSLLALIRDAIEGDVLEQKAISAVWSGNSQDLADDARGTIVKNGTFRLYGRR